MTKYTYKAIGIILSTIIAFICVNYMLARLLTEEMEQAWKDVWIVLTTVSNITILYAGYSNLKDNAELFEIDQQIKKLERRKKQCLSCGKKTKD